MSKPIFYDPDRKRWKRLRRVFDALALLGLIVGTSLRHRPPPQAAPAGAPPQSPPKRNYRALSRPASRQTRRQARRSAHRRTDIRPSQVPLNQGEGLRAAYYVDDDPASYSSLKEHIKQIDLLFPEWLHVVTPDGALTAFTIDNRPYAVVDSGRRPLRRQGRQGPPHPGRLSGVNAEVFPLINNYDPDQGQSSMPEHRRAAHQPRRPAPTSSPSSSTASSPPTPTTTASPWTSRTSPPPPRTGFNTLIHDLNQHLHARGLRLYVNTPVGDDDFNLRFLADNSDGLLLMNYDQHQTDSGPGPIAAQDWFVENLQKRPQKRPQRKDHLLASAATATTGPFRFHPRRLRTDAKLSAETPPPPPVLSSRNLSDSGSLAGRLRLRVTDRPRLRLPQPPLRLRRRRRWRPPPGLVPRRRHRPQPDARRPRPRPADLRPLAPRQRRRFALEHLGLPAKPTPSKTSPKSTPATTSTPRARATFSASPANPSRSTAPSPSTTTSPSRPSTGSSTANRWTPTRSPTPSSSTATSPKPSPSPSTTAPIPSGPRASSTSSITTTSRAPSS